MTAQTTRLTAVTTARFTSFLNVIMSGSDSCFAKQRRVPGQAEVFVVVSVIAETATRVCPKDPLPVRQVKQQQEATSLWSRWRGLIPTATSRADFRRVEQRNEPDQPVIRGFHGTDLYPHGLACHPRSLDHWGSNGLLRRRMVECFRRLFQRRRLVGLKQLT